MCRYIDELDMSRFMISEEVEVVFPMIDLADTGQIDRKTLTEWVVSKTFFSILILYRESRYISNLSNVFLVLQF